MIILRGIARKTVKLPSVCTPRELFKIDIPVTYGSDAHNSYDDLRPWVEKYLAAAGFCDGDIAELSVKDFWL